MMGGNSGFTQGFCSKCYESVWILSTWVEVEKRKADCCNNMGKRPKFYEKTLQDFNGIQDIKHVDVFRFIF